MRNIALMLCVKGVMVGSIYALISLGFNVIFRTTGVLNFAQGEFVMVGGIAAAWVYARGSVPLWVAVAAGVIGAAVTGLLVEQLAIRPARRAKPVIQIIITVGVSIILRALAALVWGTDRFHLPPLLNGNVTVAGINVESQNLVMLGAAALCMGALALFLRFSTTGKAMRACSENPDAARLCGVSPGRMSALAFSLSAALAGVAGVLLTPMLSMQFDQGTMLGLKGFSAAILGGLGNPVGGVLSGVVLGVLEQLSAWVSSVYKETLALAIVVLVLILRPKGLFGRGTEGGGRSAEAESGSGESRGIASPVMGPARSGKIKLPEPISRWRLYRGLAALLLCIVVMPLLARGTHAYLLPLAQLCGIYAIAVTGLTLLMGFTGQVSLGHAGFYAFGAYTAAVAMTTFHLPALVAVPAALVVGGLVALGGGFMVLRLRGHHLALATLCLGIIIFEFINRSKITHGAEGLLDLPEITFFGLAKGSEPGRFYFVWLIAWLVMLAAVHLTASPAGRALRAIHGDEEAAAALGVPVFGVKLKVFVLSGMLAALAGVLYALVYSPSYLGPEEFSLMLSVMLVTMVVIGGMGSIWGGLIGAVVMTSLHEIIAAAGARFGSTDISRYEQLTYGVLLVAMLIFCPRGLGAATGRLLKRIRPD